MQSAKRKADFLMMGLLFLAALYCFGDWFFKHQIVVFRDLHHYFYPLRQYTIQCLKQGIFPWWNPYILLGTPHFASLQFVVLYPLTFIYFLGDFPLTFNLFIFTHLFLTGIFAFLFFRELKFSSLACAWGAFTWMTSGYVVSSINLLNILGSITWFPLVLLIFRRALVLQERRYCFWTSIALVMMLLGSEVGITVITIWLLLGYTIVYGWRNDSVILRNPFTPACATADRSFRVNSATKNLKLIPSNVEGTRFFAEFTLRIVEGLRMTIRFWLPTLALFLGLSAFQWIPSLEYLLQTERSQMKLTQATVWSVPPWDLWNLLFPFITDPWIPKQDYWIRQSLLASYYAGSLPWIFLVWFLGRRKLRQIRWFLIGLIASLFVVLGRFSPIYQFLYDWVPGLAWIRYPARLFFIPTFLLCWLVAYGLDEFRKTTRKKSLSRSLSFSYLRVSFLFALSILIMKHKTIFDWIQNLFPYYKGDGVFFVRIALLNLWRISIIWMLSWLLFWMISRFPRYRRLGLLVLSGVLVWDLSGVHKGLNNTVSTSEFLKPTPSVEFLKKQQGYFRICPSPKLYSKFQYLPTKDFPTAISNSFESCIPNGLVSLGISDVSGYDSLCLQRYGKLWAVLMRSKIPLEHDLYHLFNARFLMMSEPLPLEQEGLKLVYQSEQVCIYQNERVFPRVFLVPDVVFMSDPEKVLEKIQDPQFNPRQEVILEKEPGSFLKKEPGSFSEGKAEIQSYSPNRVEVQVETTSSQILILSDAYYPGWKATVDKQEVPIFRADYYLRAVEVGSGHHEVLFFYHPWWLFFAPAISVITLIFSSKLALGLDRTRRIAL